MLTLNLRIFSTISFTAISPRCNAMALRVNPELEEFSTSGYDKSTEISQDSKLRSRLMVKSKFEEVLYNINHSD